MNVSQPELQQPLEEDQAVQDQKILRQIRPSRIILPVLIGVVVVGWLLYRDLYHQYEQTGVNPLSQLVLNGRTAAFLLLGVLFMVIRDASYMWRTRLLTHKQLSWRSCFEVVLMWEFASAVTPSAVGGVPLAILLFVKEKLSIGRSTALVFITIFLDEMFYLLILPVSLLLAGRDKIFAPVENISTQSAWAGLGLFYAFWIAFWLIATYVLFLSFAFFFRPQGTHKVLYAISRWKIMRRWYKGIRKTAEELLISSREFRAQSAGFWAKAALSTIFAWTARYLVLSCVLAAFAPHISFADQVLAFARQIVMFMFMLIAPTPGSSGVAEGLFGKLFVDFLPLGLVAVVAAMWRLVSFYPYLVVGVLLLPRWIKRVFSQPA